MSLFFNETHLALKDSLRRFAETELAPKAEVLDEEQGFNIEALRKMGDLGLLGITADSKHGGSDLDVVAATMVMEEFGAVCASTTLSYLAHSILAVNNLNANGSEEQKAKYLPKLCSGEWIGAMAISEPAAGSDAMGMQCQAKREGDYYVLNGTKMWITNGPMRTFSGYTPRPAPPTKTYQPLLLRKLFQVLVLEKNSTNSACAPLQLLN